MTTLALVRPLTFAGRLTEHFTGEIAGNVERAAPSYRVPWNETPFDSQRDGTGFW